MKEAFLISVIVPVYNIEEYLERCVRSICQQTYTNLEILLVDDGSTDQSGVLCEKLAEEDKRIRVFHKKNGGSSSARNLGILKARGEYLGFIDSDDYIEPDMYELLAGAITEYGVEMSQISRDEIDERGNRMPDVCIPPKEVRVITAQEMLQELLMHTADASFCTRLTKKSLFSEFLFPEGMLNEDFFLLTHMLGKVGKLVIFPKQCYHVFYRIGSNSRKKSKNEFSRVFADNVENADMVMELVKNNYPQLESVAFRFGCFQRLDYLLHIPIAQMNKDNDFYKRVVLNLRKNAGRILVNPYLSVKNKLYLFLLLSAPKKVRQGHAWLKTHTET